MNNSKTSVFFAGHRPMQLWGDYAPFSNTDKKISKHHFRYKHISLIIQILNIYIRKGIKTFIVGGTQGFDLLCAECILKIKKRHNISLVVAKPFSKHGIQWPKEIEERFKYICKHADSVINVSLGDYSPTKMALRNQWLIDNADYGIIMWDEKHSGEIFSCMKYSKKRNKTIVAINPETLQLSTLVLGR